MVLEQVKAELLDKKIIPGEKRQELLSASVNTVEAALASLGEPWSSMEVDTFLELYRNGYQLLATGAEREPTPEEREAFSLGSRLNRDNGGKLFEHYYIAKLQLSEDNSTDGELAALLDKKASTVSEGFTFIASEGRPHPTSVTARRISRDVNDSETAAKIVALANHEGAAMFNPKGAHELWADFSAESGAVVNLSAYSRALDLGSRVLSPDLSNGFGHLSHGGGRNPNISSKLYNVSSYSADTKTGLIDYSSLAEEISNAEPAYEMVILGFSANPHEVDYKSIVDAAHARGTLVMMDAAHVAGLIVAGVMNNPFDYGVDIVTTTTHKTLRGEKGAGMVVNKETVRALAGEGSEAAGRLLSSLDDDSYRFQADVQTMASHAQTFKEAQSPEFAKFAQQVLLNSRALSDEMRELGWKLVGTGTPDNHITLIDVRNSEVGSGPKQLRGADVAKMASGIGISTNMNGIPGDQGTPLNPDGWRLGVVEATIRGLDEKAIRTLARNLSGFLKGEIPRESAHYIVAQLAEYHPIPFAEIDEDSLSDLRKKNPDLYALLSTGIPLDLGATQSSVHSAVEAAYDGATEAGLEGDYSEGNAEDDWGDSVRYYEGCEAADDLERRVRRRAREAFSESLGSDIDAVVQAPSTEIAVYLAALASVEKGSKVMVPCDQNSGSRLLSEFANLADCNGVEADGNVDIDKLVETIKRERPAQSPRRGSHCV